jgi:hypothetical protein
VEMAKKLLVDALKAEDDFEVKGEIERRLKLLEPKPFCEKACVPCGKLFQAEPRKGLGRSSVQNVLRKSLLVENS